jgi:hypothetical protein
VNVCLHIQDSALTSEVTTDAHGVDTCYHPLLFRCSTQVAFKRLYQAMLEEMESFNPYALFPSNPHFLGPFKSCLLAQRFMPSAIRGLATVCRPGANLQKQLATSVQHAHRRNAARTEFRFTDRVWAYPTTANVSYTTNILTCLFPRVLGTVCLKWRAIV